MVPTLQRMGVPETGSRVGVGGGGPEERAGPSVFLQTLLLLGRRGDAARLLPAIITPATLQFCGRSFHLAWSDPPSADTRQAGERPPLPLEQPPDSAAVGGRARCLGG